MNIAAIPVIADAQTPDYSEFTQSILAGFRRPDKIIESKWLYDERGSDLFNQITDLEDYYPTRSEIEILTRRAGELAGLVSSGSVLVELGSGSSVKTRILLDAMTELDRYMPVDISERHLLDAAERIRSDYPALDVRPVIGDFTQSLLLPPRFRDRPKVLFFPGSTIGNFEPHDSSHLLQRLRNIPNVEAFVVGADLVKDEGVLVRAYDDSEGVTAAFNLNLLVRINRELGAGFDLADFTHEARWNEVHDRIEMHLICHRSQYILILGEEFYFARGETIHTENSHKYTRRRFSDLARKSGWLVQDVWADSEQRFSVFVLVPDLPGLAG